MQFGQNIATDSIPVDWEPTLLVHPTVAFRPGPRPLGLTRLPGEIFGK